MSATVERSPNLLFKVNRQLGRITDLTRSGMAHAPLSIAFLVLFWGLGIATGSVLRGPSPDTNRAVAVGMTQFGDGHVWTVGTAGVFGSSLADYILASLLVVMVIAPIEGKIGARRTAVAAVLVQVLGSLLGLGLAWVVSAGSSLWGVRLHAVFALGPIIWIPGVVLVASATMSTLWRRRVRTGLAVLLVTLALFGGQLDDLLQLGAGIVGLLLGPALCGRSPRGARLYGSIREKRVLVAIVVAASAVGPVLAALSPTAVGPLSVTKELFRRTSVDPEQVRQLCASGADAGECHRGLLELQLSGLGPTLMMAMPAILLLVVADGLRRGRRSAWAAAVVVKLVLLGLGVMTVALRYVDHKVSLSEQYGSTKFAFAVLPFLTPLAVVILLMLTKKLFTVAAPLGTSRRAVKRIGAVFVLLGVVYVGGGWLARNGYDRPPGFWALIVDYPKRLVPPVFLQFSTPGYLPQSIPATALYEWIGVVFWLTVCVVLVRSFLVPVYGADPAAAERVRALLHRNGTNALSWMTTWTGNEYWFSADGLNFVAYRVISGVALSTGDPVGPPELRHDTIVEFAEFCARSGWNPCLYSVTGEVATIAQQLHWDAVQVAEETVLRPQEIAFTGKKFQDVRTALNKAKKAGINAEWIHLSEAPLSISDQITMISEEWVADKGMPEMGFTLGGLAEMADPEVRCLIAVDTDRTVHGVTSWLPVYRDGAVVGWALDFMRRRSDGFRPTIEFLIASAALLVKDEGIEMLSLSGAPLAKVDRTDGAGAEDEQAQPVMERVLDVLGRTLEPIYGFRSLLTFKSKFQPEYEPIYMAFPDPAALASIGNAVGRAYLPDASFGQQVRLVGKLMRIG